MTIAQILLFTGLYLIAFGVTIYFTRATAKRIAGSLAGGVAGGLWAMGVIALCKALGWWQIPFAPTPLFVPLFYAGLSITLMPVYLVTWRVARRFGGRGLAVCLGVVAVIGPPRDYAYATMFPAWMVFAPGIAPILADAVAYVGMVALGHAAMRLVAGPAGGDRLARTAGSVGRPGAET